MVKFFRSGSRDAMDSLKNLTSLGDLRLWFMDQKWILLGFLVIVSLFLLSRNRVSSPPLPVAVLLYKELQKRLEKKGVHIKPHWTAQELLNSNIPVENFNQAKQTIEYYEKVRFGNQPGNSKIEKEIKASLNSV